MQRSCYRRNVCFTLVSSARATECFSSPFSRWAKLCLCSRCEWLVAVGCREWARFLHSLRGWLGGVEWRADVGAQGTLGLVLHMRPCWKGRGASEVNQLNSHSTFVSLIHIHTYTSLLLKAYIQDTPVNTLDCLTCVSNTKMWLSYVMHGYYSWCVTFTFCNNLKDAWIFIFATRSLMRVKWPNVNDFYRLCHIL